jgi:hypothetical protein
MKDQEELIQRLIADTQNLALENQFMAKALIAVSDLLEKVESQDVNFRNGVSRLKSLRFRLAKITRDEPQ